MNSRILTLVVCLVVAFVIPALAGTVVLSVVVPAKPFDQASQDAAILVNAKFCDPAMPDSLIGIAEGIVNGKHQTIPLRLVPTSKEDVFAVKQQWPSEGSWVVTISASEHMTASAIVTLGKNGSVAGATVTNLTRKTTEADITKALAMVR